MSGTEKGDGGTSIRGQREQWTRSRRIAVQHSSIAAPVLRPQQAGTDAVVPAQPHQYYACEKHPTDRALYAPRFTD
eukprot:2058280-Rhodomonas_salina.2